MCLLCICGCASLKKINLYHIRFYTSTCYVQDACCLLLLTLSGCTAEDLGIVDKTPDERCTGLQYSAHFTGGVVCYSDTALVSVAVYMCNSTHHLEGTKFRECQSSTNRGKWSGFVPRCWSSGEYPFQSSHDTRFSPF